MSEHELVEAIAARVAQLLAERPPVEPLIDAKAAAELLAVQPSWVLRETRAGRLPHIYVGKYPRYRASALNAWLDEQAGPRSNA